ncbi:hypothetical protein [Dinghuibacter silviterrae]|uniref:Uncharacterized protein n=1 Tax=Dinghuibacter silviterrae TaxID=1539049 RepID=A0A4R8DJL5_9BACT|nr:hypothetical protein [Dinghuibacter silviterrae]TDW97376.1 hypothetical protein EDB95_5224 [Dinghuibacter silviterrae]
MRYIHLILASFLLLTGCIKGKNGGGGSSSSGTTDRVKQVVYIGYDTATNAQNSDVTSNYQYDNDNRVSTLTESGTVITNGQTATETVSFTYAYSSGLEEVTGSQSVATSSNTLTEQSDVKNYVNSSNTELDSVITTTSSNGQAAVVLRTVYIYDGTGLCTGYTFRESVSGSVTQIGRVGYTYTGEDITLAIYGSTTLGVTTIDSISYTYNGIMGNQSSAGVSFLYTYFDRVFDLPVKVSTVGYLPGNQVFRSVENYAYSVDNNHRVLSITGTTASGKLMLKETFTYY